MLGANPQDNTRGELRNPGVRKNQQSHQCGRAVHRKVEGDRGDHHDRDPRDPSDVVIRHRGCKKRPVDVLGDKRGRREDMDCRRDHGRKRSRSL